MKTRHFLESAIASTFGAIAIAAVIDGFANAQPPVTPEELVAPKIEIAGSNVNFTIHPSVADRKYQLQWSETLATASWLDLGGVVTGNGNDLVISIPYDPGVSRRFYRLALEGANPIPEGFALIPAGSFQMGQTGIATPVHSVQLSAFFMGKHEVDKALWDEVRAWGAIHDFADLPAGNGKAANHPVYGINWYAMVKWCNARSEKDNLTPCYTISGSVYKTGSSAPDCNWNANGYRLPTEAEWEKAARGGLSNLLFPWGNTITHSQANYNSSTSYPYDVSPTRGYHPVYNTGLSPYTSPVGSFAPNDYGLYDMVGNLWDCCWDWDGEYPSTPQTDPHGPASGTDRTRRGGTWGQTANFCRTAGRRAITPSYSADYLGFRVARSSIP